MPCTGDVRERLEACSDLDLLERWLLAATTAKNPDDAFATR
jgi:hypothetical protein